MANQPNYPSPGPGIRMELGGSRMEMQLLQTISPPMYATMEEARAKAPVSTKRNLSETFLADFQNYVGTENSERPYSDKELAKYFGMGVGKIVRARRTLGIKALGLRK